MTSHNNNIQNLEVVDSVIDDVGEKIETVFPVLANLDPSSDEFLLLNSLWIQWCQYLGTV